MIESSSSFRGRRSPRSRVALPRILLAAAVCAALAAPSHVRAQVIQGGRIHTDVNLVSLWISVQDASGRPLTGLSRDAFSVFDEGTRQQVAVFEAETQQPLDMALMIDTSLSETRELQFEAGAAMRFIRHVVRPQDSLAVYTFSENVDRLTPYTSSIPVLDAGLKRLAAGSGTSLYDAIFLASGELSHKPPGRRRVIVLVTDTGETTSRSTFEDARHAALAAETLLYTVVVRPVHSDALRDLAGEHAVSTITDSTGGAMFVADDYHQLDSLFEAIDLELRTQYLIAFYPQPPPPKRAIRHLEVRVATSASDGPLRIHNRKLYMTEGAGQ